MSANHLEAIASIARTNGSLQLMACHQVGLATLTHTPSPMGFLRTILGRPANEKPFLLVPIGYPAADCRVPDIPKKPLSVVLHWNRS